MPKLILDPITNFTNGTAPTTYDVNNGRIETAMEKTLSRDGTSPNTMESNFDMNSFRIVNLPDALGPTEPIRLSQLSALIANDPNLKGADGATGPAGPAGPAGPTGDSTEWWVGSGSPSAGIGQNGDMYLNSANGDVYGPKAAGAWDAVVANIRGPQGPQGPAGSGSGDMLRSNNLSDVLSTATAFSTIKQQASDTATGVVELATQGEVDTGSDTVRVVTAATGAGSYGRKAVANTWTADQTATGFLLDANGQFKLVSSNPRLTMDPTDYFEYDRTNNQFKWFIGGVQELLLTSSGITVDQVIEGGTALASKYQPLDADLSTIAALSGTGYLTRTGSSTWANRTITNAGGVTITNGDGVSGNTTLRITIPIGIACSDETTALTIGTAKATFRMPYQFILTAVRASLTTAQSSGTIFTVDINEAGSSILSTKLTIDNTEKTSTTAATPAVISDANLADDAEITVDIDQVGDGTAKGLKIWLIGYPA